MKLTPLGRALLAPNTYTEPASGLFNLFKYRPSVPIVEVHFRHIDAVNLTTGDAVYGTVNVIQHLTMGFNVVYMKVGQVMLTFGLTITPQGLDFRNRDLEEVDNPAAQWTIREVRARVTYDSQAYDYRQKLTPPPSVPWHRHIETSRRR